MPGDLVEKHQLGGLDSRGRGFNRVVELEQEGERYRALFRYEAGTLATDGCESIARALADLVNVLHANGFTQLRSQLSSRGGAYLGSREPWIEYPDPERSCEARTSRFAKMVGGLSRLWCLLRARRISG
ncbi:MAG: hypothetical protein FVQ04_03865 [Nitrospira sp.]|nr:hypothetical protein [Nitrospira sp.]